MKVHLLGLVVVLASAAARAESPINPCSGAWWVSGSSPAPTDVSGLPPEPIVLLPARWSSRGGSTPDLSETALVVEVQDEAGRPVAGTLGVGLPGLEDAGDPPFEVMLWWRPTAPLAPDAYTAHLTVKSPPTTEWGYCGFTAFEQWVRFDVAAEAANVVPRATTEVTATVFLDDTLHYTNNACDREGAAACAEAPGVCCFYDSDDTYGLDTVVEVATPVPGGAYYQALEVEVQRLGATGELQTIWVYPVPEEPWVEHQQLNPALYQSYDVTRCATTRLWNLHELAVVSTSNDCAKTRDAERLPAPGPIACDPVRCAEHAVGDVAPERVDPDPATTTRDGGGCGAGPGAWWWLAAASAIGQVICRRRRPRDAALTAGR